MSEFYEGTRYRVTAFYPLLADRQVETVGSREAADALVLRHLQGGANVELTSYKWVEQRSDLAFYRSSK